MFLAPLRSVGVIDWATVDLHTLEPNMSEITITVKLSSETKHQVTLSTSSTILSLKEKVTELSSIPVTQQRLIFSGKVLKDDQTVEFCKIINGHTVHLVRGNAAPAASSTATTTPALRATATGTTPPMPSMNPFAAVGNPAQQPMAMPNASMMQPFLSSPQFIDMLLQNPMFAQYGLSRDQVMQLMSNPMFQTMLSDPNMLRSAMAMNPTGSPDTASMNPAMLSQMLSAMGGGGAPSPVMPESVALPPVSSEPPEVQYRNEIEQLQAMGFYDAQTNIRALTACFGNVNAAVEWLLQHPV